MKLNTPMVKDQLWVDFVNLSITTINTELFAISSDRWHRDAWWAILSFQSDILTHEGVYFVTANNIWPKARRGRGALGLEALFAPAVDGRYDEIHRRPSGMPLNVATCGQAEVLYPEALSTEYLVRIYVRTEEEQDEVYGQIEALRHRRCEVRIEAGMFARAG